MKKLLSISIIGILIISGLGAFALSDEKSIEEKLLLSFSHPLIKEKDDCISLELEETDSILMKKNHYMIPTKTETFIFPFGTEITSVQCNPSNVHKQTLTKKLMITPEPVISSQTSFNEQYQKYENPHSIDVWYDYNVGVGINGNERCVFVKVQTFPVQYNPSENTIEWAENIEINIKHKEPEQTILSLDDEYSFIVLAPSEYSDELQDLISHKIGRGISTKLVTLNEIYGSSHFPVEGRDDPEKIKYFIKNAIETWGVTSVLLVGGSDKFPTRTTHVYVDYNNGDSERFVSDLYYADVYNETFDFSSWDSNENDVFGEYDWSISHLYDEVDLYPDVHLGRLACVDSDEVITSVNKIISYETNVAYTEDWFTNLVVIGGDSFPGDDNSVLEGEYVNQAVIDIMDGFIPNKIWVSNGKLSGLDGVGTIDDAINEGAGFIDFSGHGNTDRWATHPHENGGIWLPAPSGKYRNTNINDLLNGDKLSIVVTGACSVGKFNNDDDCFCWSFVSSPNGGGIGSFGATALGYAYMGEYVTYGLIERMSLNTFEAYREESAVTFGELWSKSIANYISPKMDSGDHKTVEEWQSFGDPTLAIADDSLAPEKPDDPEGTITGGANKEYTYTTSTIDPDGDQVYYLFDWGDGKFSGWVGPYNSGQTAEASYKWSEKGDYEIRVKAKDDHGVQSDWSDPLPISMPKNKPLVNTPFVDLLERFPQLFPILRNLLGL